jgi:putative transposase
MTEARQFHKTLKLRVKDKHAAMLRAMARDVNTTWNFVNETSEKAITRDGRFLSAYAMQKLTAGYTKCDGVTAHAGTVAAVSEEYVSRRRQFKRRRLNWRVSNRTSPKYSLGWVPFKSAQVRYEGGQIRFAGRWISLWDSFGLGAYEMRAGSFNEDARGRWYFNVAVSAASTKSIGTGAVGIDLGLKVAATASDGQRVEGRLFRASEQKLAAAQRAGKKRQARTIHAKIKNQRKDALHKFSTKLVRENAAIFVGDVSSAKMVKTKMAKSAHDAGWYALKKMLEYKSRLAGIVYMEVRENYTTQTCSSCGLIPDSSPKGRAGLNKRTWECDCGAVHDRDVNAAQNIRRIGLDALAQGAGHE